MPRLDTTAPPNTALQRTRSAPLRSPLSFETLGAGRAVRLIAFASAAVALAVTGCSKGPSLREYRSRLGRIAGGGATDCGVVPLKSSKRAAVLCVNAALEAHRPVFVAFQVIGMDSEFYRGLAVNKDNHAIELRWDGDISGGSRFISESQINDRPCEQPRTVEDDDPIRCKKPTGA
jgi:hypothetical protein